MEVRSDVNINEHSSKKQEELHGAGLMNARQPKLPAHQVSTRSMVRNTASSSSDATDYNTSGSSIEHNDENSRLAHQNPSQSQHQRPAMTSSCEKTSSFSPSKVGVDENRFQYDELPLRTSSQKQHGGEVDNLHAHPISRISRDPQIRRISQVNKSYESDTLNQKDRQEASRHYLHPGSRRQTSPSRQPSREQSSVNSRPFYADSPSLQRRTDHSTALVPNTQLEGRNISNRPSSNREPPQISVNATTYGSSASKHNPKSGENEKGAKMLPNNIQSHGNRDHRIESSKYDRATQPNSDASINSYVGGTTERRSTLSSLIRYPITSPVCNQPSRSRTPSPNPIWSPLNSQNLTYRSQSPIPFDSRRSAAGETFVVGDGPRKRVISEPIPTISSTKPNLIMPGNTLASMVPLMQRYTLESPSRQNKVSLPDVSALKSDGVMPREQVAVLSQRRRDELRQIRNEIDQQILIIRFTDVKVRNINTHALY